ncbi:hypothetical protein MBLNU457_3527t1 [Dothideomycetes sp. NU457]
MPDSLPFKIKNASDSPNIFAYITGIAIQHNNQRCLLQSNGKDLYFPSNPPSIGSPLAVDCAIPLGPPGNTITLTVPQIAGGRLWFSRDAKLTFLLNPGPALVEPSVLNPSDPNAGVDFGFCEFTLNDAQLYANISYVDFVPRLPIAIALSAASGQRQNVAGMPPAGIEDIASRLRQQSTRDGQPWDKLIVNGPDGRPLRVLNATHGGAVGADFARYYEPYIEEVWSHYASHDLAINTQSPSGILSGRVNGAGKLCIGKQEFSRPNTADVLGCNSGPFTTGPDGERNAIIPRLAAAFVRSTLVEADVHPSDPKGFYRRDITNHYARAVHEGNADGKGYAFAYDDVQPDGGEDQSGKVNAGDVTGFFVTVGGGDVGRGAQRKAPPPPTQQQVGGNQGQGQGFVDQSQGPQHDHRHGLKGFMHKVLH